MKYAVIYAVDQSTIHQRYLRFSISSLKKHNPKIDVFVVSGGDVDIDGVSLIRNDCAIELSHMMKSTKRPDISQMTFARLYIPLIPQLANYDKVLYLDCDTEITDNIIDIFSINDGGKELCGVSELSNASRPTLLEYKSMIYEKIRLSKLAVEICDNMCWINAGVIVFNMKNIDLATYVNRIESMTKLQNLCDFNNKDEDLINIFFNIAPIDKTFNTFPERGAHGKIIHYICHYKSILNAKCLL